jgi:MFS family permease
MTKTKNYNMVNFWISLIIFGLFGQIAWMIENMYFNVFLYAITPSTILVAFLVAASAIVSTVTTIFMGALSDRAKNRRKFIIIGYILWGISTMAFSMIADKVGSGLRTAAILVIILDCVMTFFGSTANDAVFNAWVAEMSPKQERGKIEAVLSTMPLVAMLIIFGALDGLKQQGKWGLFFLIIGAVITFGGIIGIFFIKEPKNLKTTTSGNYIENISYGFRPSVVKENKTLYIALAALCIYSCSWQVFMPYLLIYIQEFLGISDYVLILAVVLVVGSLASVLMGKLIDRIGRIKFCFISTVVEAAGLLWFSSVRNDGFSHWMLMVSGILFIAGGMLVTACMNAVIRDNLPEGRAGQLQGIRIIAYTLIPMVTGPFIGNGVIQIIGKLGWHQTATYVELGTAKTVPLPEIFIASALVLLFIFIPLTMLSKRQTDENKIR